MANPPSAWHCLLGWMVRVSAPRRKFNTYNNSLKYEFMMRDERWAYILCAHERKNRAYEWRRMKENAEMQKTDHHCHNIATTVQLHFNRFILVIWKIYTRPIVLHSTFNKSSFECVQYVIRPLPVYNHTIFISDFSQEERFPFVVHTLIHILIHMCRYDGSAVRVHVMPCQAKPNQAKARPIRTNGCCCTLERALVVGVVRVT